MEALSYISYLITNEKPLLCYDSAWLLVISLLSSKTGYNSARETAWFAGEEHPFHSEKVVPLWLLETMLVGMDIWVVCPHLENCLWLAFSVLWRWKRAQSRGDQLCHATIIICHVLYFAYFCSMKFLKA